MNALPWGCASTLVLASLLTLAACDPGHHYEVEVSVSDELAAGYDEQQRAMLVIEADGLPSGHHIVCGSEPEPIVVREGQSDLGCPAQVEVRAFLMPLAADDTRACGELTDIDYLFDLEVDPAWPQASGTLRDPCRDQDQVLRITIE